MKRFVLCVLISYALLSCSKSEEQKIIELPVSKRLDEAKMEVIEIPPVLFKEYVFVVTDNFFLSVGATPDTLFRVFDKHTLAYLGGFGREGDGPNDYRLNQSIVRRVGGDIIQIGGGKLIRELQFRKLPKEEGGFSAKIIKSMPVPKSVYPLNYAIQLNDSTYAGATSFKAEKELVTINTRTKEIGSEVPFPNYVPHIPANYNNLLYQRVVRYSSVQNKLASAYIFLPALRIYDFETEKAIDVHIKPEIEQLKFVEDGDGLNLNMEIMYTYYHRIEVTDNYIYAQYQLISGSTAGRVPLSNRVLHIFDFEGNLVSNLRLEDWMGNYAISPDDKYAYFWHPEEEDRLYRYSLEGLLEF